MNRVVGIDHLSIRVSDFEKSKTFYGKLLSFLGFKVLGDYGDAIGWTNGKTRYWIGPADERGIQHQHRIGDVGFHHYAFELRNRNDIDELHSFVKDELGATVIDPPSEYYKDYYAVYFLDPDGLKLEAMKYGKAQKKAAKTEKAAKAKKSVKKKKAWKK